MKRVLGTLVVLLSLIAIAPPASAAQDPCGPDSNEIVCENSKPGAPRSEWDFTGGAGESNIQGFATEISVNRGERIDFKVESNRAYTMNIYRTGYYGGLGARKWGEVRNPGVVNQPACLFEGSTGLVDCDNWSVTGSWTVPTDAVSGIYVAHLDQPATGDESHITFIVRNDSSNSDVVFQTADTTWQAYNTYGGNSLYQLETFASGQGGPEGRAYKVSYNRPFSTRGGVTARDFYFASEYPMVQFLEANGVDISYISGIDSDRRGDLLLNHKTFLSVGHDEYWSGAQRANVEFARDAGVNLAFFGGNDVYWRTRYEPSIGTSAGDYRTLVCYKETKSNAKIDPSPEWTGTFRDLRFPEAVGSGEPENGLMGSRYQSNTGEFSLKVPAEYSKLRFWRDTSVAQLTPGEVASLAPNTLGYEFNEVPDDAFRPAGLVTMSRTTVAVDEYLADYGSLVLPSRATHSLSLHRAPSGALVFSSGTIQWPWGLGMVHDGMDVDAGPAVSVPMQQATLNLLADMSVPASTPMPGLVAASKTTDASAPSATIVDSAPVGEGESLTEITGTAVDFGGGTVAGVEVSIDDGATWHPATGTADWTYRFDAQGVRTLTARARAIDDSGNIGAATAAFELSSACPCTMFGAGTPEILAARDDSATSGLEVAVRFTSSSDGYVTALRFFRGVGDSSQHVGRLYRSDGILLAEASFPPGDTDRGWKEAALSTPVFLTAGQEYVASTHLTSLYLPATPRAFQAGAVDASPLTAVGSAFRYGSGGVMPTTSFTGENYWVDVKFDATPPPDDTTPPVVLSYQPGDGATGVDPAARITVMVNEALQPGAAVSLRDEAGNELPGETVASASRTTFTFTPDEPLPLAATLTASVSGVRDLAGNAADVPSWSFTVRAVAGSTIFGDAVPAIASALDSDAVEVGTRFTAARDGELAGLRFYKGADNLGTHEGRLYAEDGSVLAQVTFRSENPSGWQTATLTPTVRLTAGAQYTVAVHAPQGGYATNVGFFASAFTSGVLTATQGVYRYGAGGVLPTSVHEASNYWVDVLFVPDPVAPDVVAPVVESVSPADGAVDVDPLAKVAVGFDEELGAGAAVTVAGAQGGAVAGQTVWDAGARSLVFVPDQPFAVGETFTVSVSGVEDLAGNATDVPSWSFTVRSVAASSIFADAVPDVASTADTGAVEVGMRFTADRDGVLSGVRFYKGAANTGTHVGRVYAEDGSVLAEVTFLAESGWGWQTAAVTPAVALTAGSQYTVAVHAPQGGYAFSGGFFGSAFTAGDLTATQGVYLYGSGGTMPVSSYQNSNYWVDVLFVSAGDTVAPAVTDRSPAVDALDVAEDAVVSVTFDEAIEAGSSVSVTAGGSAVAGATAWDAASRTLTFTPDGPLAAGTAHEVSVTGVQDAAGNTAPALTWTFTTKAAPIDVVAPVVESVSPADGAVDVDPLAKVAVGFDEELGAGAAVTVAGAQGGAVAGQTVWDAGARSLVFVPDQPFAVGETFTVSVSGVEDLAGNATDVPSWSFTVRSVAASSIFADAVPDVASAADGSAIEVGTRFTADRDGVLSGVRFYKGADNTGTHVGRVYAEDGSVLAEVTFLAESGSGWQTAAVTPAVALTAGAQYTVGVHAPKGGYSVTRGFFDSAFTAGDLTATQGVYLYGSGGTMPVSSYQNSNYWVDVLFVSAGDTVAPAVTDRSPAVDALDVAEDAVVSVTFDEAIEAGSSVSVTAGGSAVAGATAWDAASRTLTFTPDGPLAAGTAHEVSVTGVQDAAGNTAPALTWTFTTAV